MVEEVPATCLKEGKLSYYRCTVCGKKYLEPEGETPVPMVDLVLPKTGCVLEAVKAVPATCTEAGNIAYYVCAVCDRQYLDETAEKPVTDPEALVIPKLDHDFGPWEVVEEPGPDKPGREVRSCKNCAEKENREIPALTKALGKTKLTVKADSTSQKPVLTWTEVADAEGYLVYRATGSKEDTALLKTVKGLTFTDAKAVPGVTYRYTVMAVNETSYGEESTAVSILVKCAKPVVTASADADTGKPVLKWEPVEGAVKYEVYRSIYSSKKYKLAVTTEETSAILTTATTGTKYYYKVKAICENSDASSGYSAVVSQRCLCARPVIAAEGGESGGIKLSWEKVEGAKKYQVYRATSKNGTYTKLTTTSSLSYTDTKAPKNKTAWYKVRAYGSDTNSLGEFSGVVSLVNHTFGAWKTAVPSMPESEGMKERVCTVCGHVEQQVTPVLKKSLKKPSLTLTADDATGLPKLSWTKIDGASKYYIYQVDASGNRTWLAETKTRSYLAEDAQVGKTYAYQVMAVSSTKCSDYSTKKSVVCKCPKPVLTMESQAATGKPIAKWEAVEGAVKYEVYRSVYSSKNYKLVATTKDLSAVIDSSTPAKTYYYRVKAIGKAEGSASANSAYVKYVTDCAAPEITPSGGASGGIKISWEKVEGAKKYQVYRATSQNGTYTKLTTTSSLSYTDTKAPKNKTSWYKVKAYGSDTASLSDFSKSVSYINHTFGDWKTVVPSMPETEGLKERVCTGCGHVEQEVTPVLKRSLKKPTLTLTADSATGLPKLSWTKIDGASKYYIYQVDASGNRTWLTETKSRSYLVEDAQVGNSYSYQVMAVSSTKCSDYSTKKTVTCKCAKPVAQIEGDAATGRPWISWEKVKGAVKYRVYRATSSSGTYTQVAETEDLRVLITGGSVGKTYYYRVRAVGKAEATLSERSAYVKFSNDCAQPVLTAEGGENGGIKLSWEKVEGAKKYQVYRATSQNGTYTKVTTTSSLSYTDTKAPKNATSWYKLRAYGSDTASLSAYSAPVSAVNHTFSSWKVVKAATPEADGYRERTCSGCGETQRQTIAKLVKGLDTPAVSITAQVKSGKPTLSWDAVSKATGYRIYVLNPATGKYRYNTTVQGCTFVYDKAVPAESYSFLVVAVNETQCSDYGTPMTCTAKCAVPQIKISMDPVTYALTLSWNGVEGAASYDIYRSASLGSGYKLLTTTADLSTVVTDAIPGVPQYFKIRANHSQTETADSILSAAVSMDGETTELVIHAGWATETCNKITWGKIKNAKTYAVYRADSLNGSYTKIATVKGTEHVDLPPTEGITHYYRVKAYDEDNELLSTSQKEAADKKCEVPLKIYVSPSSQPENKYAYGSTNEAKECRKVALALVEALERCGFSAMTNVNDSDDMYVRVPESNAWGANLHVPIHSNAYNKSCMGTQVYHDGVSGSNSRKAARNIYNKLAPLTPGTSGETIKKHSGLYEFNKCNNPTAYIEIGFHDTTTEAKWIINNTNKIAEAICKGICTTYGMPYVKP